ncbi:RsfA family transcriptional regulator [Bacillus sp. AFS041924]|uniref:RsfA family transcriptional regulator n=1 Tax=Bacillus sp. AFS041924 TaxID=2033503 RepID=UPI000BFB2768|nr:RsfA family transcriptional regulator [Bacillus sp. AFS041924]PGS48579.1 RsfA family transcriptional regulator [Bacillus sp. AFS041924]
MVANRQDAWTKDEDNYLAEVVLKMINEGSTQLMAFKVVAKNLSRTAAACGYRWNSFVRKFYKEEIEQAKASSKKQAVPSNEVELKHEPDPVTEDTHEEPAAEKNHSEITFESVYKFLEYLRLKVDAGGRMKDIQSLEKKLLRYKQENEQLKVEKQQLVEKLNELQNEYENLFDFLDQRRKIVSISSKNDTKVK